MMWSRGRWGGEGEKEALEVKKSCTLLNFASL